MFRTCHLDPRFLNKNTSFLQQNDFRDHVSKTRVLNGCLISRSFGDDHTAYVVCLKEIFVDGLWKDYYLKRLILK